MKKLIITGLAIATIFTVSTTAFAAQENVIESGNNSLSAIGFVDEDGDGSCDNQGLNCQNSIGYLDEDGDGYCDNSNRNRSKGTGFNVVTGMKNRCGRRNAK